jgi:hypothetical protein
LPKLQVCTDQFISHLKKKEGACEKFDIAELCLKFFLDAIMIGMFGVNLHTIEDNSEGAYLLHEIEEYLKEYSQRRAFNPVRKFMFWDKDWQIAEQAVRNIDSFMLKILNEYRSSHTDEETKIDQSIMGHLVRRFDSLCLC